MAWVVKWKSKKTNMSGSAGTFQEKAAANDHAKNLNRDHKEFHHWVEKIKK